MVRHTGMCRPNGLLFQQKSLDMGPSLVEKFLRRGSHFAKIVKNGKISHFEVEKPLEMGPDLRKFRKKAYQPFFEGEKSLDIGKRFRPWAAHPSKNNSSTPPPGNSQPESWFTLQSCSELGIKLKMRVWHFVQISQLLYTPWKRGQWTPWRLLKFCHFSVFYMYQAIFQ